MTQQEKYDDLLQAADARYAELKAPMLKAQGVEINYLAPECFPSIRSHQVKAMLWVLAGALVNVSETLPTKADIFRGGLGGE
jgi:hypothetical protein